MAVPTAESRRVRSVPTTTPLRGRPPNGGVRRFTEPARSGSISSRSDGRLHRAARGDRGAARPPGSRPGRAACGRAALAHEERLGDRLDRLRLLAHGDGERRQPDRAAAEPRGTAPRARPGRAGPARARRRRTASRAARAAASSSDPVAVHLRPSRGPGAAAGWRCGACRATAGRSRRAALVGERDAEQAGRPAQDLLELGRLVEVQVTGEPEPVAQRAREHARPGWWPRRG